MPPQWPNLVLAADVPHSKANVLIFYCFHVETYAKKQSANVSVNATDIAKQRSALSLTDGGDRCNNFS